MSSRQEPAHEHVELSTLKAVDGYPGYYASTTGRVYVLRELSVREDYDGYLRIAATRYDKKLRMLGIHQAVCRAFHGPPPFKGAKALHQDDDKKNNRPENLRWGTDADNTADTRKNRSVKGLLMPNGKLTEAQVVDIKAALGRGVFPKDIAARFGVSEVTIYNIKHGRTWRHV